MTRGLLLRDAATAIEDHGLKHGNSRREPASPRRLVGRDPQRVVERPSEPRPRGTHRPAEQQAIRAMEGLRHPGGRRLDRASSMMASVDPGRVAGASQSCTLRIRCGGTALRSPGEPPVRERCRASTRAPPLGRPAASTTRTASGKAGDLPPGHALQIDPHAEAGGQIAEFGEVRFEPTTIRIIPADAQPLGSQLACGLEHGPQPLGREVRVDDHELDVVDADPFALHALLHLTHRAAPRGDRVIGRSWEGRMQPKAHGGVANPCRETDEVKRRNLKHREMSQPERRRVLSDDHEGISPIRNLSPASTRDVASVSGGLRSLVEGRSQGPLEVGAGPVDVMAQGRRRPRTIAAPRPLRRSQCVRFGHHGRPGSLPGRACDSGRSGYAGPSRTAAEAASRSPG